tara:strand:- start:841 stop:1143 length:303 start_codon:yes stop_codon:yes gene_type:complete
MKTITAKLGNMRKEKEWVVYPFVEGRDGLVIQCDKRIAQFDPETGEGRISDGKGGHPGFLKLQKFLGATEIVVPEEVREAAKAAQPQSGDTIGNGVVRIA